MHSVLFVCTANVCRSPMALGLMKARVADQSEDWKISSAGTWAMRGQPASTNGTLVLKNRGIDINHLSKEVDQDLVFSHHLILVMERGHKEAMRIEFPQAASKIYLLSEMIGQQFDIADPFGSTYHDYEITANEIDAILQRGFEIIEQLALENNPIDD